LSLNVLVFLFLGKNPGITYIAICTFTFVYLSMNVMNLRTNVVKKIEHYVVVQQLMLMLRLGYCKI